jgi:2'-5' RNA ligase
MGSYSFWIQPTGEVRQLLQETADRLAAEHSTPTFQVHLTLYPGFESSLEDAKKKLAQLATGISQFELELADVGCSTTYFQCVLLRAKTTAPLLEAHMVAQKAVQGNPTLAYLPHISLVYGDLSMEKRVAIAESIKLPTNLSFKVETIDLTPSVPDPKDWEIIESVSLPT